MSTRDDIDALAGEYVLGTLPAEDRASVAARRTRDAELDAAIRAWEQRLAPLADLARPAEPSAQLKGRIQERIAASAQASGEVIELRSRLAFWRRSAIAASALAASLIIAVGVREMTPPPKSKNLVAVLQKDAQSPAFLVSVDVDNKLMTVRPVAAPREAGKSYELWIVHDSLGAPRSLGVIDEPGAMERPTLASYKRDVIEGATLAVSLEPEGGSPTGAPTGPVVFAGKMIEASR